MAKLTSPILKNGLYMMAAVVLAGSTIAFKSTEKRQTEHWFEVNPANNQIIPGEIDGNPGCSGSGALCAVSFDESQLENGQPPMTTITDEDDPRISQLVKYD